MGDVINRVRESERQIIVWVFGWSSLKSQEGVSKLRYLTELFSSSCFQYNFYSNFVVPIASIPNTYKSQHASCIPEKHHST